MSFHTINSLATILHNAGRRDTAGITFISGQDTEEFLSYAALEMQARAVLYNLQAAGVQPGDEVVLQLEDNKTFLLVFWACVLGKIIPVPLSFGGQDEYKFKLFAVWQTLQRPFLITTDDQLARIAAFAADSAMTGTFTCMSAAVLPLEDMLRLDTQVTDLPVISREDIAYVQYSSGSTGNPKGVILTHDNLLYNTLDIVTRSQTTLQDKCLSWMPLTHDMGMICFHLSAVLAGVSQYLLPTALFIRRPALWLAKASEHGATQLYSPNFGFQYLLSAFAPEDATAAGLDLSAVRIIYNGAEPIDASICRNFQHTLAPFGLRDNACFPGYGLAEASVAVTLPQPGDPLEVYYLDRKQLTIGDRLQLLTEGDAGAVSFVTVGYPIDHCKLRIAGANNEWIGDGVIGHVQIKGENVTAGYYQQPLAAADSFTSDGWLRTGDVGFMLHGRLVITGRAKNILIINGQNYYPHDIERVLQELPGMELGKVVACAVKQEDERNDNLILFILHKKSLESFRDIAQSARRLVFEKTGLAITALVPVKKIPKTTSGKIQNFKLAEQFKAGEYDEVLNALQTLDNNTDQQATTEIGAGICRIWKDITGQTIADKNASLLDTGISSLLIMRFITLVNAELLRKITIKDFFDHASVSKLEIFLQQTPAQPPVTYLLPAANKKAFGLTLTQRRFLMLELLQPQESPLNITQTLWLQVAIDEVHLEAAAIQIAMQHEALRATFLLTDNGPEQRFGKEVKVDFTYRDLSAASRPETAAIKICEDLQGRKFDLEKGPLWRIGLVKLEDENYLLCIVLHHIISDGWTMLQFKRELAARYRTLMTGQYKDVALSTGAYTEYLHWYETYLSGDRYQQDKKYWLREFDQYEKQSLFQSVSPYTGKDNFAASRMSFTVEAADYTQLQQYCAAKRVSVFAALLTLVSAWLYKYTGRTDLAIGTDNSGRLSPELETVIGCFINTIAIRSRFSADRDLGWLLAYTGTKLFDAYEHQLCPADMVLEEYTGKNDTALLDVLVLFQNFDEADYFGFGDIKTLREVPLPQHTSLTDLTIEFVVKDGAIICHLDAREGLFDKSQAAWFPAHFYTLFQQLLHAPQTTLRAINIMGTEERQLLLAAGGEEHAAPVYEEQDIVRRFETQVRLRPDTIALIFEGTSLTYEALNAEVNRWVFYLKANYAIGYGDRVGICIPRSDNALIALLAVLKAGASYVALDPEYPAARLQFMLADSNATLILTTTEHKDNFQYSDADLVEWEQTAKVLSVYPAHNPDIIVTDADEAYVIYTSGTTGKPKGVSVSRGALYDYAQTVVSYFNITATDRVIQQSALSFDTLIEEVFPALCQGASVHILREGGRNVAAIIDAIQHGANILSTTPTVVAALNKDAAAVTGLRLLISGGEALQYPQVQHLLGRDLEVYNTYGPSETTVCATYYRVTGASGIIPIGKPVRNRKVYLLNDQQQLVPAGATGEIYIGGAGVANGYLNLPDITAHHFINDPFAGHGKLYKTGDLGRLRADGNIDFLGRKDQQVKINGYRIETEEIAQQLNAFSGIQEAAVVARRNHAGREILVCFYTSDAVIETAALKDFAQENLPFYMIPAAYVQLPSLPVTGNGKTDYKVLQAYALEEVNDATTHTLPTTEVQVTLLQGWNQVLEQNSSSITGNFFESGGNSLLATRLLLWIQQQLGVKLTLRDIFRYPTVQALAGLITNAQTETDEVTVSAIRKVNTATHYPVSYSQKRLWLLDNFSENKGAYNLSWAFTIKGALDLAAWEKAFQWLVNRHEILRTNFDFIDNVPQQRIREENAFAVQVLDYRNNDTAEAQAIAYVQAAAVQSFDLQRGPLLQVSIIRLEEETALFVLALHHIIGDAWSMEIIASELSAAYNAFRNNETPALPPLQVQYKDFASWQQQQIEGGALQQSRLFWQQQFQGNIPVLQLPEDHIRPAMQTYNGHTLHTAINEEVHAQLQRLAQENACGLFVVLLASVKALLYRVTGQTDLIVGAPVAGRVHPDLASQVGFYVNTLPLRTAFEESDNFNTLIGKVKHTFLQAFEHQAYPFDLLVEELDILRDSSRTPLFNVMADLLQTTAAENEPLQMDGLTFTPYPAERATSQFDLSFDFAVRNGALSLSLNYNTDIFNEQRMTALLAGYLQLLQGLLANSGAALDQADYLPEAEKQAVLAFSGKSAATLPAPNLVALFENIALQYADKPAVQSGDITLTYQQLNELANQLADSLIHDYHVRPGDRVGIMTGRNPWMVAGVLAILKTRAAYVPVDPEYTAERVSYMLADSGIKVLVTDVQEDVFTNTDIPSLNLHAFAATAASYNNDNRLLQPATDDLAYLIYTSGSTGKPKGVKIAHRELLSLWDSLGQAYALDTFDVRLLQVASLSFDVFFGDLLRSVFRGGVLVICDGATRYELPAFCKLLQDARINILESTPGLLLPLMDYAYEEQQDLSTLRILILGSDTLAVDDYRRLQQRFGHTGLRIINSYGTTETTIDSSFYEGSGTDLKAWGYVPVGRPLGNTRMYVLDKHLRLCGIGMTGELCIGGIGVGQGYWNQEELTTSKFVNNPYAAGELYRTGDLARWTADGNIEFLGRGDHQVKVRGYRIEPGEIENVLQGYAAVKEVVVMAPVVGKERQLVSYIVWHTEDLAGLRAYVREQLPAYMHPQHYITMARLPLTANGKIDRLQLPLPQALVAATYEAPRNEVETTLVSIWETVLECGKIGITDNFFEKGGHSLKAIKVLWLIRRELGTSLSFRELFTYPRIIDLSELLAANRLSAGNTLPLVAVAESAHYPLSHGQRRMWLLEQMHTESNLYTMPVQYKVQGPLNTTLLKTALQQLVNRHESLRTIFRLVDGEPRQYILSGVQLPLVVTDLRDKYDPAQALQAATAAITSKGFDLQQFPLLRAGIIRTSDEEHVFVFNMHHIISDEWSAELMVKELLSIYRNLEEGAGIDLPALPVQYKDYAAWQHQLQTQGHWQSAATYWQQQFAGALPVITLPADQLRPAQRRNAGTTVSMQLPAATLEQLYALGNRAGTSLFMTLLASIKGLLYHYSGQEDLVIGSPVAGRSHELLASQLGFYVNTLALRTRFSATESFDALLASVQGAVLGAQEHADYPFDLLVETIGGQRDISRTPLFDVMMVLQHKDSNGLQGASNERLRWEEVPVDAGISKFDLTFLFRETADGLTLTLEYNTDLFSTARMERCCRHYREFVTNLLADSSKPLQQIGYVPATEKKLLTATFNTPTTQYPDQTLHGLFEAQVKLHPDAVAVKYGTQVLTYAALNNEANRLAAYLHHAYGVGMGDRVGVMVSRSERLIVSLLGILKTGAAYVPIDPAYPAARIQYMLEDSEPKVVLAETPVLPGFRGDVMDVQAEWELLSFYDQQAAWRYDSHATAYMIYTSGSTGRPKGAMVAHGSVVNLCSWLQEMIYDQHPSITAMLTASINFDASVQQLFAPLLSGASLVIIPEADRQEVVKYVQHLIDYKIGVIDITPGYLRLLLSVLKTRANTALQLKYILVGGEALTAEDRTLFHEVLGNTVQLINVYGVTEATVNSAFEIVTPDTTQSLSIGRPLKNTQLHILDNAGQLAGIGIPGELCIGGAGVGLGYWNNATLTNEKFIEHTLVPQGKLYRTGDLARWTPLGIIEYIGRADDQVKIRGHRIELGEIENVLLSYPGIREVVVLAQENGANDRMLVSYLVWQDTEDRTGLQAFLNAQLPSYMHPAFYITLTHLPLNNNGKVDRRLLPLPDVFATETYEAPRNATEAALVKIWEEVLQCNIGITDNFFGKGGHSLKGIRLLWRIREELGVEISFRDLFTYPRITDLATLVHDARETAKASVALTPVAIRETYALSHAQRRMWLLDQLEEQGHAYTLPVQYLVNGPLDVHLLEGAFNRLIAKHEILRTVFKMVDNVPQQQVLGSVYLQLDYADIDAQVNGAALLDAKVSRITDAVFDLQRFPLLQAGVYRTGNDQHVLVFNMHHIISDEWSGMLMMEALFDEYEQLRTSQTLEAVPAIQYKDYSAWQQQLLQSTALQAAGAYWQQQFAGEVPVLELPCDEVRPGVRRHQGRTLRMHLSAAQLQGLQQLGHRAGASLFMTLLAAVKGLLYRYTGQEDIVIGSPVAGRTHPQLASQLGFYANTLALRTRFSGHAAFDTLLQQVKNVVLSGLEYQDYPFDLLVEELALQRDMSRSPLFDVMVVLQQQQEQHHTSSLLQWQEVPVATQSSKFDLTWFFREAADGLEVELEYNTDIFSTARMNNYCLHFTQFVDAIIADSTQSLLAVNYLPQNEQQQLLEVFNDHNSNTYPRERSILQLFDKQVRLHAGKTAVVYHYETRTYAELNREADLVAAYLQQVYAVTEGDRVGLMMERSDKMIVCLLGILKAGAAYVPIDPAYPESRIRMMLEDSAPRVVLIDNAAEAWIAGVSSEVMDVSAEWELLPFYNNKVSVHTSAQSLAYIIYTSGSTGRPKGVMVPHLGVVRLVYAPDYVSFAPDERLLQTGSVSFDASTFEIWGMLLNGGTLYLEDHDTLMDNEQLQQAIRSHAISMMWFSAPWFNQLVDHDPGIFAGLKTILVGGDKLSARHINQVKQLHPGLRIINGYGPTENTTFSICYTITDLQHGAVPLGKPVSGTQVYILDHLLQLVPSGIQGEIYLAGDGLATGYLNLEDKTSERFIDNPFTPGTKMYRTGDYGRWNYEGLVEFLGRTDDQVKIRGFRIEPGEIENTLLEYPGIKEAVVVPFETPAGEKELAAYLVWETSEEEAALQAFLRIKLPSYLHPGYFVTLAQLPLNANGKVDRQALPAPRSALVVKQQQTPRNEREAKLLIIWKEILQRPDVGIHENFFEKGGHSLRASSMLASVHKTFGVKVSLRTLFQQPTIAGLASVISGGEALTYESLEQVALQAHYPLSHAQHRLWILDQMDAGSGAYNIPGAYNMQGNVDRDTLEKALQVLVARHESLRTIFISVGGEPRQQIISADDTIVSIIYHDLSQSADVDAQVQNLQQEYIHASFELGTWPLFCAVLIRTGAAEYKFVFCIHHIISDGWSQGVIGREISVIYNALRKGEIMPLPALTVQYKDYSEWHTRLLQGQLGQAAKEYWTSTFAQKVPALNMPADRLRPRLQTFDGDVVTCNFGAEVTARLQQFSQEYEATMFMSLLALTNTLLYRYTGVDDIVISSPIAAREHAELHGQIGFYANTLAFRTRFSGDQSFETLLQAIRENTFNAYRYQMYPYDSIVEDARQEYDPGHAALSDVMLVLQSNDDIALQLDGIKSTPVDLSTSTARFDLVFIFTTTDGALCLDLGYNTNIYDRSRIESMVYVLKMLLHHMLEMPVLTVKELATQGIRIPHGTELDVPLSLRTVTDLLQKHHWYILDADLQPVGEEVPGQLYLALNDEELRIPELQSLDRYVVSPFRIGQFLYHTGYYAACDRLGNITLKSKDTEVATINGRVVYGTEVNAAVRALPGIGNVWTQVKNERSPEVFVTPHPEQAYTIRRLLQQRYEHPEMDAELYRLPNGLSIYYKNKTETDFTYKEVFEQHAYLKNGVTLFPGDVIFDVGANIGMFSLYAGHYFPGCKVFSFEPIPPVYRYLAANAGLYDMNIVALNMGLSSEETQAEFSYYPNNTIISGRFGDATEDKEVVRKYLQNVMEEEGNSMSEKHMEEILDEMIKVEKWECRLGTLSNVIREQGVEKIDLLKIDVEKSEWDILLGLEEVHWGRIRQIIVEVHDLNGRLHAVTQMLHDHGFDVVTEQEDELAGTSLYNIYAIHPDRQKVPAVNQTATVDVPTWTDMAAYETDVRDAIQRRLPAYLGDVKVHFTDVLPVDANGDADRVKIAQIKAYEQTIALGPDGDANALQISIAATFTADPLTDHISWWMDRFEMPVNVQYAPYNQVFQELLQEDSLLSRNTDVNLLLVRWEDWMRDARGTDNEKMKLVENSLQQLVGILQAKEKQALYLVGILPLSPANHSAAMQIFLERMNQQWLAALQQMEQVHVVDFTNLDTDFNIAEVYDAQRDKLGHIPYSEEAFAAMATTVARQVRAYKQPAFKLIVVDCDNTLWAGVCGEDGVSGVQVLPEHAQLQSFLKQKAAEGFLLAIASKNNEADVWEVFEQHPGMVLRKEDFITWRINWNNKPDNIRDMVRELNIGINTCCFIDDSPMECAAVTTACPEVFVWQLPEQTQWIPAMLRHLWVFDKFTITAEDRSRTAMYKAEQERQQLLDTKPSISDFLSQLDLVVTMQPVTAADTARVAQLTERTNQFNLNGVRYTETDIRQLDASQQCHTIRVKDKFGDYGLAGVVITKVVRDTLQVEACMLSCRVLGRQVEGGMLVGLKQLATENGLTNISAALLKTSRNKPFQEWLDSAWAQAGTNGEAFLYTIPVADIPDSLPSLTLQFGAEVVDDTITPVVEEIKSSTLVFDHIGVAVSKPEAALPFYAAAGFTSSELCHDPIQNVNIYMCRTGYGAGIELVAPYDAQSPVNNMLRNNGAQPYHFCYRVTQFDALYEKLQAAGLQYEIVKQPEPAVLFDYKRVVFINIQDVGLVEFIEDADTEQLNAWHLPPALELSMVTFNVQPALQFFGLTGYKAVRHVSDHAAHTYTVTLHGPGGSVLRIITAGSDSKTNAALFLQKNGAHLYRIGLPVSQAEKYADMPAYFELVADVATTVQEAPEWEWAQVLDKNSLHYALYLPLIYYSGRKLLEIPVYQVQQQQARTDLQPPQTQLEKGLFEIWAAVLRHRSFGIHTSFLAAGGNSIKATQVLSHVYRQYGVELLLTDFFNKPTIKELASLLGKKQPQGFENILPLADAPHYALSFAQQQLWVSDQFESAAAAAFNIPVAYNIDGEIDKDAITYAFQSLVNRHEVLRTVFVNAGEGVRQFILPEEKSIVTPVWIDLSTHADPEKEAVQLADQEAIGSFDLERGPLLRIKIITLREGKSLLLFTTHHIISDGWSAGILLKEAAALYNSYRNGEAVELPALRIQYKDFAGWQQTQLQLPVFEAHKKYWHQQFEQDVPLLQLPYDFARPSFKSYEGRTLSFSLGADTSKQIKALLQQQQVSMFMFFMAATKLLLYRLSGQQDLVVGFPVSGRQHPDLEDQVGCYVNTIALRTQLNTSVTLCDFLQHIKTNITEAYAHAAYPFERLVEELGGHRDLSRAPLFDVMVQIQDAHVVHEQDAAMLDGLNIRLYDQEMTFSKYDLTVNIMERDDDIGIDLEYTTALFGPQFSANVKADLLQLIQLFVAGNGTTVGESRVILSGSKPQAMQQIEQLLSTSIDESF